MKKYKFEDIFNYHSEFVKEKFPGHTVRRHINKLQSEIKELAKETQNKKIAEELIDVFLVSISLADQLGLTPNDILTGAKDKIEINKQRNWEKQTDGTWQHTNSTHKI